MHTAEGSGRQTHTAEGTIESPNRRPTQVWTEKRGSLKATSEPCTPPRQVKHTHPVHRSVSNMLADPQLPTTGNENRAPSTAQRRRHTKADEKAHRRDHPAPMMERTHRQMSSRQLAAYRSMRLQTVEKNPGPQDPAERYRRALALAVHCRTPMAIRRLVGTMTQPQGLQQALPHDMYTTAFAHTPGVYVVLFECGNQRVSAITPARAYMEYKRQLSEWVRDLTREGVEPNPGPNYCEDDPCQRETHGHRPRQDKQGDPSPLKQKKEGPKNGAEMATERMAKKKQKKEIKISGLKPGYWVLCTKPNCQKRNHGHPQDGEAWATQPERQRKGDLNVRFAEEVAEAVLAETDFPPASEAKETVKPPRPSRPRPREGDKNFTNLDPPPRQHKDHSHEAGPSNASVSPSPVPAPPVREPTPKSPPPAPTKTSGGKEKEPKGKKGQVGLPEELLAGVDDDPYRESAKPTHKWAVAKRKAPELSPPVAKSPPTPTESPPTNNPHLPVVADAPSAPLAPPPPNNNPPPTAPTKQTPHQEEAVEEKEQEDDDHQQDPEEIAAPTKQIPPQEEEAADQRDEQITVVPSHEEGEKRDSPPSDADKGDTSPKRRPPTPTEAPQKNPRKKKNKGDRSKARPPDQTNPRHNLRRSSHAVATHEGCRPIVYERPLWTKDRWQAYAETVTSCGKDELTGFAPDFAAMFPLPDHNLDDTIIVYPADFPAGHQTTMDELIKSGESAFLLRQQLAIRPYTLPDTPLPEWQTSSNGGDSAPSAPPPDDEEEEKSEEPDPIPIRCPERGCDGFWFAHDAKSGCEFHGLPTPNCSARGCPMPPLPGGSLCKHHKVKPNPRSLWQRIVTRNSAAPQVLSPPKPLLITPTTLDRQRFLLKPQRDVSKWHVGPDGGPPKPPTPPVPKGVLIPPPPKESGSEHQFVQANVVPKYIFRTLVSDRARSNRTFKQLTFDLMSKVFKADKEWALTLDTTILTSIKVMSDTSLQSFKIWGKTVWSRPSGQSDESVHTALQALGFNQVEVALVYPPLLIAYFTRTTHQAFLTSHNPDMETNDSIMSQVRTVCVDTPTGVACNRANAAVFENTITWIVNHIAVRAYYARAAVGQRKVSTRPASFLQTATGRKA